MSDWKGRVDADMMRTFPTGQALLVRGEGTQVWDEDGNRYLDFLAGIAVNSLGHAHPAFVAAVTEQAATLAHASNLFNTPPQLELAARLKRLAGTGEQGRVFFANSGAEANEAALKLARRNGSPTRTRVLSVNGSFHGRTMGALALTGKPSLQEPFLPMLAGVEQFEPTLQALRDAIDDTVQAVVLEPIRGEAGVRMFPDGFLAEARELTRAHGALLILDEVQTGIGRTGTWFAFEQEGIVPDAITLAKGLGGGFPIGALVTFGAASELFEPGQHGTTFGGNALATAVGSAVLRTIEDDGLLDNVRERSAQIRSAVASWDSPLVDHVRGRGLLLGIQLTAPIAAEVQRAAFAAGLIVNAPAPDTIRLAPPLIVSAAEVEEFSSVLAGVLSRFADETDRKATA
ncbi:MAG: acetylornithine transaminase [Mycetocola reblochoni]|uniref:Acetylornithine aminotransferase n=2 Tax=Mycetocola reblochoni TaxID=331618 RepID=A0A1R4IDN1_9MICO|nr:acetylornithine transaminase [Mycetocola reblochoni]RLP68144.1 acetylornithine transaminase [Mycetocola reblochoni]SJN17930.1 Acetylornithine aminotransferase [Mycetocola reblochoni REB411]